MKHDASRHPRIAALVLTAAGVLITVLANADEAADRKAEAQRLFAQGQAALDKGDAAKGCELMRTSLSLFAVANSLFNVAQCDEREGKLASALEHWKRGNSLIDATDKRAPVVKKAIEDLEVRVPRVRIVLASKHEPAEVLLDEEVVPKDKLEAALFLDPGKHVVTVRKKGHEDRPVEILLAERERTEVVAEPGAVISGPIPTASASPSVSASVLPPPRPGPSPLKVGGFIAVGVGAAGILGAIITGVKIESNDGEIRGPCKNTVCSGARPSDLIEEQKTLLPINATLWGVGIAGAAAGTVMLVVSSRKTRESTTPTVAPLVFTGGGGISLSGRF